MRDLIQLVYMWLHQEGTQVGSKLILTILCKSTLNILKTNHRPALCVGKCQLIILFCMGNKGVD